MSDDTLIASLARAQAAFKEIEKSHTNDHFRSKYADHADVLKVVRPALAAQGIAVLQPIRTTDEGAELGCVLAKGAEREESWFPMPTNLQPQALMSWLTYMKRGMLCALVGVHPSGEDDDGNAAQADSQASYKPRERTYASERPVGSGQAPGTPGKPLTDAQRNAIGKLGNKLIKKLGWSPVELSWVMSASVGKEAPDMMSVSEASKLMDDLIAIDKGEKHATFTDDGALIGDPASLGADGTEPF